MTTTAVLEHSEILRLAGELHQARSQGEEIETVTSRVSDLSLESAYEIQEAGIELRIADGDVIVGGKLGFTSKAMQQAMGVDSPNYGWLTEAMIVRDNSVSLDRLIHPKVEPEIGFLLGKDLPPNCSRSDVLEATESVFACLEIVDSRFHDFRFEALDNIADNSSAGMFVVSDDTVSPAGIDLRLVGVVLHVDGQVSNTAAGAAALDDPAEAVAWMARNTRKRSLRAGDVVISGGLTAPIDLERGAEIGVAIDRVGEASFGVV